MIRQKYIARKEPYGWLLFNPVTQAIQRVNSGYIEELKKEGMSIREVINPYVKRALSAPIKVFIDVTNHCNLQCLHCLSSSKPPSKILLPYNYIHALVENCYELGVFIIKLGGGEPLLRDDIWKIVDLISHKGIAISMSTNGTILDAEIIHNLKKYNIAISVSIDGDEKIHDYIRGEGVYKKAVDTLKRLKEAGINPSVRFTLMTINQGITKHVVSLSNELGVRLRVRRARPQRRTIENNLVIREVSKEYFEILEMLNLCKNCEIEDIMNFSNSIRPHLLLGPTDCGAGTRSMHVNFNGGISPCIFLGNSFVDGNIYHTSLMDVWKNGKKTKIMRNIPLNNECKICARKLICHGECPAIRLYVGNSLNHSDPSCLKYYLKESS